MKTVIGAVHEFHDQSYVTDWANRFNPAGERIRMFELILAEARSVTGTAGRIVELGIGPGYLAGYLLAGLPDVHYYGVDFSEPMFAIARDRLAPYAARVSYINANLVTEEWWTKLPGPVDAIVTTWSLHDLGGIEQTMQVYQGCARLLRPGGLLLNGDFIKPEQTRHEFEPGRFAVEIHLQILRDAGFSTAECLALYEQETETPASAQNYACFRAVS